MQEETYLPFDLNDLRQHFYEDIDANIKYFENSVRRYVKFRSEHPILAGLPIKDSKQPRQIEKDERFWTLAATKCLFDSDKKVELLSSLLSYAFGKVPTIPGFNSWAELLQGDLRLYYEASLPAPEAYLEHLASDNHPPHLIPYVRDAAQREGRRVFEGATQVDAVFVNPDTSFLWVIEAKVLSDVSPKVSYDCFRNQIARNIDVMLEAKGLPSIGLPTGKRDSNRSIFTLLTPRQFKNKPHTRLYGWLMREYQNDKDALARDLSHRNDVSWEKITRRIGWITFEDIAEICPGACRWLTMHD